MDAIAIYFVAFLQNEFIPRELLAAIILLHISPWCDAYLTSSPMPVPAPIPRGSPKQGTTRVHHRWSIRVPHLLISGCCLFNKRTHLSLTHHLISIGFCLFNKRTHFYAISACNSTVRSSRVNVEHTTTNLLVMAHAYLTS